jgi:AraC-like DNA-binding protein
VTKVSPKTELCYAVQLIAPFRKVIRTHPSATPQVLALIGSLGPHERLPIVASEEIQKVMVDLLGDPDLGLRAARGAERGDYDVLEYASASAATFRAALETNFRYAKLLNDAADFRLEVHGDKAYAILHMIIPVSRVSADFRSAAFYLTMRRGHDFPAEDIEVWFTHKKPASTAEYDVTFGKSKVVFGAPLDAVLFPAKYLDRIQTTADPNLHSLLRAHAERLLQQAPPTRSLLEQVRSNILQTMPDGSVSADRVASRLHMSRRTLTRHLAEEGTTFKALLDETRRHSAGYYLQTTSYSVEDIAFLLGFSESAAFVRAFKRWTQSTPAEYRRTHRKS